MTADQALVDALDARARALNRLKEAGDEAALSELPPDRVVIERTKTLAKDFPQDGLHAVLVEVLSASRAMLAPEVVAYVGQPGSNAERAARAHFGSSVTLQAQASAAQTLDAVAGGDAAFAVLPLETPNEGAVTESFRALSVRDVSLCGEVVVNDEGGTEARFGIIGTELPSRTQADRTVIAMAPGDTPGALYGALKPFAERDINLTRLESRSSSGTDWHHVFFLELDGHITDRAVLTAVEELRRIAQYAKVLGSYPRP